MLLRVFNFLFVPQFAQFITVKLIVLRCMNKCSLCIEYFNSFELVLKINLLQLHDV